VRNENVVSYGAGNARSLRGSRRIGVDSVVASRTNALKNVLVRVRPELIGQLSRLPIPSAYPDVGLGLHFRGRNRTLSVGGRASRSTAAIQVSGSNHLYTKNLPPQRITLSSWSIRNWAPPPLDRGAILQGGLFGHPELRDGEHGCARVCRGRNGCVEPAHRGHCPSQKCRFFLLAAHKKESPALELSFQRDCPSPSRCWCRWVSSFFLICSLLENGSGRRCRRR